MNALRPTPESDFHSILFLSLIYPYNIHLRKYPILSSAMFTTKYSTEVPISVAHLFPQDGLRIKYTTAILDLEILPISLVSEAVIGFIFFLWGLG